jgi:hypothetical protein
VLFVATPEEDSGDNALSDSPHWVNDSVPIPLAGVDAIPCKGSDAIALAGIDAIPLTGSDAIAVAGTKLPLSNLSLTSFGKIMPSSYLTHWPYDPSAITMHGADSPPSSTLPIGDGSIQPHTGQSNHLFDLSSPCRLRLGGAASALALTAHHAAARAGQQPPGTKGTNLSTSHHRLQPYRYPAGADSVARGPISDLSRMLRLSKKSTATLPKPQRWPQQDHRNWLPTELHGGNWSAGAKLDFAKVITSTVSGGSRANRRHALRSVLTVPMMPSWATFEQNESIGKLTVLPSWATFQAAQWQ